MSFAMASALPVASSTTRSSAARLAAKSASSSGVVATRPAERARPPSATATSEEVAMHVQTDRSADGGLLARRVPIEGGGGRERYLRIRAHERTRASRKG